MSMPGSDVSHDTGVPESVFDFGCFHQDDNTAPSDRCAATVNISSARRLSSSRSW